MQANNSLEIKKTLNEEQLREDTITKADDNFRKDYSSMDSNTKYFNNKPWNLQVFQVVGKNIDNSTEDKVLKKKPQQRIKEIYLHERQWFQKKYEREIGKISTRKETDIQNIEKCLRCHRRFMCTKETSMFTEYIETPRPDNIPDVVWRGPLMRKCGCPRNDCECQGNIVLPPKVIPLEMRYTWHPKYYLRALTRFKKWQPQAPQKTFAQRLLESVEAETHVYKQLNDVGALESRGPEFCINRCYYYYTPEGKQEDSYSKLKKQLLNAYYKNKISPAPEIVKVEVEESVGEVSEETEEKEDDDIIIDGYYRTISTQARTGPNGEFLMGKISHILFGRIKAYNMCDIEGKKINVYCYDEFDKKAKPLTDTRNWEKILSFKGITSQISKLTTNLFSSIIEIKDTGIPVNTQATQDPPLDNDYQYILEISLKDKFDSEGSHDTDCPCCNYYKTNFPLMFEENKDENDLQIEGTDSSSLPPVSLNLSATTKGKNETALQGIAPELFDDSSPSPKRAIPQDVISPKETKETECVGIETRKLTHESPNNNMSKLSILKDNVQETMDISKTKLDEKFNDEIRIEPSNKDLNVSGSDNVTKTSTKSLEKSTIKEITISTNIDLKSDDKISDKKLLLQISKTNLENIIKGDADILQKKESKIMVKLEKKSDDIVTTVKPTNDVCSKCTINKVIRSNELFKKSSSVIQDKHESNTSEKQISKICKKCLENVVEKEIVISQNREVEMVTNLNNDIVTKRSSGNISNKNTIDKINRSHKSFKKSLSFTQDNRESNTPEKQTSQISKKNLENIIKEDIALAISHNKEAEMISYLKKESNDIVTTIQPMSKLSDHDNSKKLTVGKKNQSNESLKKSFYVNQDKHESDDNTPDEPQFSKEKLEKVIVEDAAFSQNNEAEIMKKTSARASFSINQDNSGSNNIAPKSPATESSKIDVHMCLNNKSPLQFHSTQKPSVKSFIFKNSQRVSLRNRIRNVFSYEDFKLHVKKSFQKTSSAFSTFFKCVDFTSYTLRHSRGSNNHTEKEDKPVYSDAYNNFKELVYADRNNSKISEEEMFSLQYNSNLMSEADSSDANAN